MTNFIENLLQISITMAAVIGILLLLIPVWQKRYSAKWRKLIWLIIAVRLLVPFSIELPSAPVQMNVDMHEIVELSSQPVHTEQNTPIPAVPNKIDTPSDIVVNTTVNTTTPTDTIEQGILLDRGTVLFAIWLIGLAVFIIYHIVQYCRFYGKIMDSAKPLEDSEELLERAGTDMGLQRYPAVLLSGNVQSPMLIGFRTPMIVLPYKLYGENELVMILRHELTHYKHHDLWYKLILLCANALHWFNPLVWMMNRQAGRDIEQVCDDYVVAGQDMDYRKAYSMTILNTMASQKGVALSTHLSKDAQNTKKRFAGILQPKTYKKGIAVFAAVLILAVGISGCLQVGKVDEGVALYNRVAEYLPENAIYEPEVYEVWGVEEYDGISYQNGEGNVEKKESDFISYLWAEDLYEVTEEEFNQAGSLAGYRGWHKDEGYFLSKRSLIITILKETGDITSITYGNTEEKIEPVKPSEIGRNKEQRDAYVHQIAADLLANGDTLVFREALTDTDENSNATLGYYVCGTEADPNQYVILIDYTEGTLKMLRWIRYDAELREGVMRWRDFTFMLEGMEETVRLELNRQSGYYALYTDSSIFHRVPQEFNVEGAFLDRYVRRVEPNLVQCYIQVGYVPNMTIGEWLDEVETNKAYAQFRPQTNPLATYLAVEWEPTGNYKVFPNEPNRQWREYITISGAYNVCYLTPYRDGVMIVQYSHPFGAEDFEGMGSRMAQMIDTLVLATEGEEYTAKKQNSGAADTDNGIALYNQIAPFLPEHAVEDVSGYQRTRHTDYTEYVWGENPFAVYASSTIPPKYQHPYGLMVRTDNDTGAIRNYHFWYDETQITFPAKAENYNEVKAVGTDLAKQFMQKIVPNGENLSLDHGAIQMEYQTFTAIDKELHRKYQISVDGMHGYISSYSNAYYNAEYMDVAQEWLYEEFRDNLGDKYQLYSEPLAIDDGSQRLNGDAFTWNAGYNMYWRYQPNRTEQKAIDKLQETVPEQFRLVLNNLNTRYTYQSVLKVTGDVKANGDLKKSSLQFYDQLLDYESPMSKIEWNLLEDKLQITWIAASFANAWNHHYAEAMALYGETEGVAFAEDFFDIYQEDLAGYAQSALGEYSGENAVEIQMPLERNGYECSNYLYMTLEKTTDGWYVTNAVYNKGLTMESLYTDTDYDGDGGLDTVLRIVDLETDTAMYEVQFSNGDVLEPGIWYGSLQMPSFEGADLNGDGQNEIVFLVACPTSTNPLAMGELAVFMKEQDAYHSAVLPFAQGDGIYEQRFVVTYNKADGQAIEVSVEGTDFSQIIEIPDHLWNGYGYKVDYVNGVKHAHTVWNYRIQEQDGISHLVCSIQLFDKWSTWGLDIVLGYEDGHFVVEDVQFCEDIYEAWT